MSSALWGGKRSYKDRASAKVAQLARTVGGKLVIWGANQGVRLSWKDAMSAANQLIRRYPNQAFNAGSKLFSEARALVNSFAADERAASSAAYPEDFYNPTSGPSSAPAKRQKKSRWGRFKDKVRKRQRQRDIEEGLERRPHQTPPKRQRPSDQPTPGLSRGEAWSAAAAAAASAEVAASAGSGAMMDVDAGAYFGGGGGSHTEWGHQLARIRTATRADKRAGRGNYPGAQQMAAFKQAYTALVRPTIKQQSVNRHVLVSKRVNQATGTDLEYSRSAWGFYLLGSLSEYKDAMEHATADWTLANGIYTPPAGYIEKGANVHFHETCKIMNDATIPQYYTVWECNLKEDWDESGNTYPAGGTNPSDAADRTGAIGEYACDWDTLSAGPNVPMVNDLINWDDIEATLHDSVHWRRTFTIGKKWEFKLGAGEVMTIERDVGGTFDFDEYDLLQNKSIDYLRGRSKCLVVKCVGMYVRDNDTTKVDGDAANDDTGNTMLQSWTKSHIIRDKLTTCNVRTVKPKIRRQMAGRAPNTISNSAASAPQYIGSEAVSLNIVKGLGVSEVGVA